MIPTVTNPMGVNSRHPLTLTALADNSTVQLTKRGNFDTSGIYYRTSSSPAWAPYSHDTVVTLAKANQYVQFWNRNSTLSQSNDSCVKFVLTGELALSGHLRALINYSRSAHAWAFANLFAYANLDYTLKSAENLIIDFDAVYSSALYSMFWNCAGMVYGPREIRGELETGHSAHLAQMFFYNTSLKYPPKLYQTHMGTSCCLRMFYHCENMEYFPALPATALAYECYSNMFDYCYKASNTIELPATVLYPECYRSMFWGCTSLVKAPILPATVLPENSYRAMFGECSSLNGIEVNFTDWNSAQNATKQWLQNVSASGTFKKPSALPETTGIDNIPSGWTVVNK